MATRKQLSKRTRFEVFKRDGFVCQYCGAHPPQVILHVDHIVPVAEGGGNEVANLITACSACNLGKGAVPLGSAPTSLEQRAAEVAEREAQIRGYAEVMEKFRARMDDDSARVARIFAHHFNENSIRNDWFQSIWNFVEKLGVHDCVRAMEIAVSRKPWSQNTCFRYFCGICWNMIRETEDA